jgi:hypothetical protein
MGSTRNSRNAARKIAAPYRDRVVNVERSPGDRYFDLRVSFPAKRGCVKSLREKGAPDAAPFLFVLFR